MVMNCSRVRRRRVVLEVIVLVATIAGGCKPSLAASRPSESAVPAPDTVRGTLRRVGNDPVSVLTLSSKSDDAVMAPRGALLDVMGRAVGLEVMLSGKRSDKRDYSASPRGAMVFDVEQFFVRAAEGQSAVDGILGVNNGKYFLTTMGGQKIELTSLPQELRRQVGGRVFLVGDLKSAPTAYGILAPAK